MWKEMPGKIWELSTKDKQIRYLHFMLKLATPTLDEIDYLIKNYKNYMKNIESDKEDKL